jgi:hypothetical protein
MYEYKVLLRLKVRSKVPSGVTISWIYFYYYYFSLDMFRPYRVIFRRNRGNHRRFVIFSLTNIEIKIKVLLET